MKTRKIKFERKDDGYLYLLCDGKTVHRWKIENLPKDDSFNTSPDRSFVDLVHSLSRQGNAVIVEEVN